MEETTILNEWRREDDFRKIKVKEQNKKNKNVCLAGRASKCCQNDPLDTRTIRAKIVDFANDEPLMIK